MDEASITSKTDIGTGEQPENFVANKETWIAKAIERESIPKPERKETVEEFAKKYGISSETYFYQMRKKENKARIVNIWLNQALDGGNEVLNKLKDNALEGKEKSIEMYLKFVLELAENLDVKSDGKALIINKILYGDSNSSPIQSKTISDTVSQGDTKSTV